MDRVHAGRGEGVITRYVNTVPSRMKQLSIDDTAVLWDLWHKVGEKCFTFLDVKTTVPSQAYMGKLKDREIIVKRGKHLNGRHYINIWQIRSDVADRLRLTEADYVTPLAEMQA